MRRDCNRSEIEGEPHLPLRCSTRTLVEPLSIDVPVRRLPLHFRETYSASVLTNASQQSSTESPASHAIGHEQAIQVHEVPRHPRRIVDRRSCIADQASLPIDRDPSVQPSGHIE